MSDNLSCLAGVDDAITRRYLISVVIREAVARALTDEEQIDKVTNQVFPVVADLFDRTRDEFDAAMDRVDAVINRVNARIERLTKEAK
jgi:ABC-type transporter Mla subunit MlaD